MGNLRIRIILIEKIKIMNINFSSCKTIHSDWILNFYTLYHLNYVLLFHILNFLGNKSSPSTAPQVVDSKTYKECLLDADSSSTKSGRRPSLDTVSTYLSQESRESQITSSTAELIHCSASSEDGSEHHEVSAIVGKLANMDLEDFHNCIGTTLSWTSLNWIFFKNKNGFATFRCIFPYKSNFYVLNISKTWIENRQ